MNQFPCKNCLIKACCSQPCDKLENDPHVINFYVTGLEICPDCGKSLSVLHLNGILDEKLICFDCKKSFSKTVRKESIKYVINIDQRPQLKTFATYFLDIKPPSKTTVADFPRLFQYRSACFRHNSKSNNRIYKERLRYALLNISLKKPPRIITNERDLRAEGPGISLK